jgi:hypothetical protein
LGSDLNALIKNLRIPLEDGTQLARCLESRTSFLGVLQPENWLRALYQRIGAPLDPGLMLLPMAGVQRVACLVYGDGKFSDNGFCSLELLEIAAGQAGLIFENLALRKQLEGKNF